MVKSYGDGRDLLLWRGLPSLQRGGEFGVGGVRRGAGCYHTETYLHLF